MHKSESEELVQEWVVMGVWWGEREYSVECGIRTNVVMLWLRMGLKVSMLDSVG